MRIFPYYNNIFLSLHNFIGIFPIALPIYRISANFYSLLAYIYTFYAVSHKGRSAYDGSIADAAQQAVRGEVRFMGKIDLRRCGKMIGLVALAFGIGILVTFFISVRALVIIEAIVLILVGLLFLL